HYWRGGCLRRGTCRPRRRRAGDRAWDHGRVAEKRRIGAGRASAGRGGDDARLQRPGGTVAGMTWVTAGAMSANALSYVLYLLAGRLLLPAGYGMFASLVTAQLVLAVPALALQAVIARGI